MRGPLSSQLSPSTHRPARPRSRWPVALLIVALGLLLATGLVLTQGRVEATTPKLSTAPTVLPGGSLSVSGLGFVAAAHVELGWDGIPAPIPAVKADSAGGFVVDVTVPDGTRPGLYTLTAVEHAAGGQDPRQATTSVRVLAETARQEVPAEVEPQTQPPSPDPGDLPMPPPHGAGPAHGEPTPSPLAEDHPATAAPAAADDHAAHGGSASAGGAASPAPTAVPATPKPDAGEPVSGHPVSCVGYPEPRVFLEVHAWWEGEPLSPGQIAHLHAGTCFPLGQTVSGKVAFDVRIVMHDNPGQLYRYETGLYTDGHGEGDLPVVALDHRCPATCEFWVRTVVDTSGANDGWHELRFKPRVRFSDGTVQFTSTGWPLRTENGNPDGGFRDDSGGPTLDIVGRGWFDEHGYQNAVLRSVDAVLPGRTVSGVWQPTVRLDSGAGGAEPTLAAAYLNPDFHHHDEDSDGGGIVLGSWAGAFRGELSVDTRSIANGHYTLVLRVEAKVGGTRVTGLQYIPIVVQN